ncbi:hypothetical protein PSACC_01179, partial [Paramicrosporidium saccamoebae]
MYLKVAVASFLLLQTVHASTVLECNDPGPGHPAKAIWDKYFETAEELNARPIEHETLENRRGRVLATMFDPAKGNGLTEMGKLIEYCRPPPLSDPRNWRGELLGFYANLNVGTEGTIAMNRVEAWDVAGCGVDDKAQKFCLDSLVLLSTLVPEPEFIEKCEKVLQSEKPNDTIQAKGWSVGVVTCLIADLYEKPVPFKILQNWDAIWNLVPEVLREYLKATALAYHLETCAVEFMQERKGPLPKEILYYCGSAVDNFLGFEERFLQPAPNMRYFGYDTNGFDEFLEENGAAMTSLNGPCKQFLANGKSLPIMMRHIYRSIVDCHQDNPDDYGPEFDWNGDAPGSGFGSISNDRPVYMTINSKNVQVKLHKTTRPETGAADVPEFFKGGTLDRTWLVRKSGSHGPQPPLSAVPNVISISGSGGVPEYFTVETVPTSPPPPNLDSGSGSDS